MARKMKDKEELKEIVRKSLKRDTDFSEQLIDTIVDVVTEYIPQIVGGVNEIDHFEEREQVLHTTIMTIIANVKLPPPSRIGVIETVSYALKKQMTKVKNVGGEEGVVDKVKKTMFG